MKMIKKASLLFASLALVLGAGLVGSNDTKEVKADTLTDTITASDLEATSTTYTDFSNVSFTSGTIYAGNNAKTSTGGIQLRSKNSNSGIVSTSSIGSISSVSIVVASGSNKLDIYGSNTAYSSASDLYKTETQGTKLGTLNETGTFTVPDGTDYSYIGLRSNNGAIYLTSIDISWNVASTKTVESLVSSGTLKKTAYQVGDEFDPTGLTITAKYDDNTSEDVTSKVTWPAITSGMTSITGSYAGKEITIEGIHTLENVLSIVADKTSASVEESGQFKYTFKDSSGNDVSAELVEWKSSNENVVMVDENTGEWLAMGVGNATITLSVMDSSKDIYEYKLNFVVTPMIPKVTISDLLSKTANDNTVVSVKGKVANLTNTTYGNFDLVDLDDPSKSILVYGSTKDSSKLAKKDSGNGYYTGTWTSGRNFNSACVEGDIITMEVIFVIYNGTKEIQGVITNVEKPSQSIELNESSLVIKNGESAQLTATLTGLTGNVAWTSDNTDVAEVANDGTITTKSIGNAKIIATLNGVTADCDIAVIENSGEDAANALTVEEAIYIAKTTSTATSTKYFIKGIIAAYVPNSSDVTGYGNISFDISDDGTTNNTFKAYQVFYLGGEKFTSTDQISVGDEVVLYGAVLTYNNIQETDGKGAAYVYSHTAAGSDAFVAKVNKFDLCNSSAEEIKAMLDEYDALLAKDASIADVNVDEATTLAQRMAYMQLTYNKKINNVSGESTSGVVITSTNSFDKTSLIALFAILGIVTISGYYIIEKKKLSK